MNLAKNIFKRGYEPPKKEVKTEIKITYKRKTLIEDFLLVKIYRKELVRRKVLHNCLADI